MPRAVKPIVLLLLILFVLTAAIYYTLPQMFVTPLVNLNRDLAGLKEYSTTVADHEVHYLDGGQGQPVLLLHGIFSEKDHWVDFARKLTPDHRVIVPDIPGFGASSRLANQSYQYAPQVERLHAFIEQLGIRQFHLAGNSMGGTIAALYAVKYPEQVLSVAFIGAPHGIRSPQLSEADRRIEKGEIPLIARNKDEFDQMMNLLFVERPFLPRPILLDAQAKAARDAASNVRLWEDQRRDGYLLNSILPQLKTKTLVLWGENDRIFDHSGISNLRAQLPSAHAVTLRATGHLPMMEYPAKTAEQYRAFLEARESQKQL